MEVCVGVGGTTNGGRILCVSLFFEIADHQPLRVKGPEVGTGFWTAVNTAIEIQMYIGHWNMVSVRQLKFNLEYIENI